MISFFRYRARVAELTEQVRDLRNALLVARELVQRPNTSDWFRRNAIIIINEALEKTNG